MSSSSEAFAPLAAPRVTDATSRPATPGLLSIVPAQREQAHAEPRPAFTAAHACAPAAVTQPVPARFVPLVEPDDDTATMATHEQARAAGFAAGFAAGSREAAKVAAADASTACQRAEAAEATRAEEHAEAMATLAAAVDAVRSARVPVLDAAQDQLHAAAIELAAAVLGVELSDAPTAARAALARVALPAVAGDVVVRMCPRDADVVVAPAGMRVVADARLAHGDAVVEHGDGELDARIASALDRARAVLAHEVSEDEAHG
ncbi:MAG: flagellar assembly protein FliH [Micrococcales bacterium]|nr:flagellar assembly protein FliH [Micrococcales bacterium]